MRSAPIWLLTLLLSLAGTQAFAAPPAAPPPPDHYKVTIRYRLAAARNEHVRQFREMVRSLEGLGFVKDPGPEGEEEDSAQTHLTGTVAAGKTGSARDRAHRFLAVPHVAAVLLVPEAYQVPAEGDKPVKVQIDLTTGLPRERQRVLADQLRERLPTFGFRESVGYYNRGHTRMVGTVPAGNLEQLLRDMRWQPEGWLLPEAPFEALPLPIRTISPIQVVEVLPQPAGEAAAGKELPAFQPLPAQVTPADKITADVRALVEQKSEAERFRRLEVILSFTPDDFDRDWLKPLKRQAPGLQVEGRLGPILTVLARPDQAPALAELPYVSTVRLPYPALRSVRAAQGSADENARTLRESGLERLHAKGFRGAGVRVAVVDSDFRGYEGYLGKGLPARVGYVDLTQERRPSLQPEPYPDDGVTVGHGTQCALALALAAPDAEIILIRIDPAAPYQLLSAARYLHGESFLSYDIENRQEELVRDEQDIKERREELLRERKAVVNNFGQDPESVRRRQDYLKREAQLDTDEKAFVRRYNLLQDLIGARGRLKSVNLVSCSLGWNQGYPLAGSGSLSRYLDDTPFRRLWFQSAGNTRRQAWSGLFRDQDGNRVMEFSASPESPRPDLWTNELNFLAWAPSAGNPTPDLPANATVRLALQWREPHDPESAADGEDVYRRPLATVRLVVLRQLDPEGKARPADDLEVVAWSSGLPERLENRPDSATYEVVLEFKTSAAGRYAVRVEGIVPPGLRPESPLPAGPEASWEMNPHLFVEVVDAGSRRVGRPVFRDYFSTGLASLGMPGDAQRLLTVGAASPAGTLQPYSAGGPATPDRLLTKPDLLVYDALQTGPASEPHAYGTDLATAFGAGLAASRFSAGVLPRDFLQSVRTRPGNLLRAPVMKPVPRRK
jgi:hypothetical protein